MKTILSLSALAAMILFSGCASINPCTKETCKQNNTVQQKQLRIVCLGDSITGSPNLRKYMKYSSLLDCMLEARLGAGKAEVINRGIGGDTTDGALKRLQKDVLNLKPDIVLVLLGGNDSCGKIKPEIVKTNLTVIVQKLKKNGAKVMLMQYHCIPNPASPKTAWLKLQGYNSLIAEVAAKEKVALLDLSSPMNNAYQNGSTWEFFGRDKKGIADWRKIKLEQAHLASTVDGVHLNHAGEIVFAKTIFAKLLSLGWIK